MTATYPFPDLSTSPLPDLLSLRGRRAIVTGGAQGLGRAIAQRFAEAGAEVVIGDVNASLAATAAAEITELYGVQTTAVAMDVTDEESVASATTAAEQKLGGSIGIWVNNAGIFPSIPVSEMTTAEWDHVFAVNTRGTFLGAREAARRMTSGGVLINIASTAGFRGTAPGLAAYVSSKHAARGLTKQLALELAPRGIRVLGVAPTFVPTEGNRAAAARPSPDGIDPVDVMRPGLLGRHATPDDIARVVLFCATGLSAVMTGSTLLADAGLTI
ncbi:Diacetyl reductase [(S)-acetoin forming] [Microbacterium azadirachtae]|uniref:Diacetyl reductase [(S)-acetoin forming] n=1 Tax=Microbacterium azadirachtae TaxID=582680 RepID=A0A0F0KYI6_9MICO|nr:SDR family oxidoreductase [Microbacterium azadirachtae]KJL24306.1 Diacetyl reductase [(S)-acetoin forming] [Microbacterium azadirachtae]